ncbi:response regulator [Azospirillum sp. SYSU D00513]|uniref:response regulator n=1 Tax=Azospirillum sp. SYSU D00513 TaxID=2812561 RepID=UPI001A95C0B4|nr:response regulator [Azospirillum sp. SYSU D00513]
MPPEILIVEDDAAVRRTLRAVLTRLGYGVLALDDGAFAALEELPAGIRLALVDLFMPRISGAAAIARIRREAGGVRVIAMSGGSRVTGGAPDTPEEPGPDLFLQKPFEIEELRAALASLGIEPSKLGR